MACEDRQLTQAQREEGFTQNRTGVIQAVRPFTGRPTLENLIDYINRELQPAIRATRNAVNDVYLPVVDNAPSANPLAYYFSTETGAADPTAGRIRLNQATQNTATVLRISEDNARLQDVLPWLEVMAGGVTAPLGVVTLYDAVNPARFLRFDLDTMTDQGDYWDLGVTIVESSHDNPFVEGGAVTLSYIPGVADNEGLGAQIPPASIEPIATDTFLGNISGSTAAPSAVPLASVDSTSITYDGTAHEFRRAALTGFAEAAANSNATTSAEPIVTFSASSNMSNERVTTSSTSITVSTATAGQIEFRRAAVSGFVDIAANANTATTAEPIITYQATSNASAERVLSDGHMTTVDLGTTGQAQVDIANMTAGTVIGRQIDAGTGAPVALTGAEQGENVQFSTIVVDTTATGTVAAYSFPEPNNALVFQNLTVTVQGIVARPSGTLIWLRHTGTGSTTLVHQSGSAASADTISTGGADIVLTNTMQALLLYTNGRWRVYGVSHGTRPPFTGAISAAANSFATLFAGIRDNGSAETDRTNLNWLSTTSVIAAITDDAANDELEITYERAALTGDVTAAQNSNTTAFRSFSAVSVLARAANSAGVPTELAAAANDRLLARTSDALSFTQLTNGMVPTNTVGLDKLANIASETVLGNISGSSGAVVAVNLADLDSASIIYDATSHTFQRAALTGDVTATQNSNATTIAADAVTNAKLANMAAGTVKGLQIDASGPADPVDLTGAEVVELLRWATTQDATISVQQDDFALNAATTVLRLTPTTSAISVTGITGGSAGRLLLVENVASTGNNLTLVSQSASSLTANRFRTPNGLDLMLRFRESAWLRWDTTNGDWRVVAISRATNVADQDYGDITVTSGGQTWTIDAGAVTLAKMANLAAGTVIGRQIDAGTGAPVALTGAEQGENVQFATIVTDSTSSGTFTAFDFPAPNNALVFVNTSVTLQGVLARPTGTVMLLRHSGTGATTLSNENASASANDRLDFGPSGTPDLVLSSGMQALFVWAQGRWRCYGFSPCVLNEDKGDVTVSGSRGQTWTIDNAAVSLAKMANLAESRIIGRAEGGGTGVPQALTPTQVVSIIDGESVSWTGVHAFDGEVELTDRLRLNSIISPTALTADQDNYSPTNWATANIVRLSTDGTAATVRDITGAAAGTSGEVKYLINLGPGDIRLQHEHASSTAANRFLFASLTTHTLDPHDMSGIWYDATSARWRLMHANPTS